MKRNRKKLQKKVTNYGEIQCRSLCATFSVSTQPDQQILKTLWIIGTALLSAIVFSFQVHAQISDPTSVSATRSNKRAVRQAYVTYGAEFNIETFTGINTEENANYQGQYGASFGLSIPTQSFSAIANFGWSQEYSYARSDGRTGEWIDPSVRLIKSIKLRNLWIDSIAFSGSGTAALNKESKLATYRGSLGGSVSAQKRIGKAFLSQSIGYSRSFFEYDIQDDGTVNVPNNYSLSSSLSYSFNKAWMTGGTFRYTYSTSYQNVGRARQLFNVFAAYKVTDNFAISGGLFTLRGTLEPDGQTNRLRFIDPNSTAAYINLGLSI